MRRLALPLTFLLAASAQAAPVRIEFWHAMDQGTVAGYAQAFNRSQSTYEVVPVAGGNYRELNDKLQAALKAGKAPPLAQVEFTRFARLAADGGLTDLSRLTDALPGSLTGDLYPPIWRAGEVGGKRYGLPWNVSVPVLMYNAGALRREGVSVPGTWAEVESVSRQLATRGRRPLVAAADAWTFEANVTSRGGSLVVNGRPNLNGPEAVAALTQLARMSEAGVAQPRRLSEATRAAFDFARGQNLFVAASVANWTDARKLPFFQLGIAPFPCGKAGECSLPLGGAHLVVPQGASPQEQAGAVAFWQFLMEPARLAEWVKSTAYAPTRRSVTPLLNDWYARNPQIRAAHAQLDHAVPRPTAPAFEQWTLYLEDAISQATTGKLSARAALDEAQRKAEGK
ncbi:ABC transporter substrate-binding protein [Deinococcus aetherius]|uniref:ABC transporter substrate-binding protein n=1 Tax=Deinococcus aetherius TaxID=200252 RepID=A0ABM8AFB5_9DEIO|nr:ABC transporter substrate-binding protein [Deinococcus aetherius]BDP42339.1 ABC transporter substrate-binding protein [Deinococcus aetherius]